jgi:hypothetical protein
MKRDEIDLGRWVLDHQLYDRELLECGKVDDIELALEEDILRVIAVRSGPGEASERVPGWLRGLVRFVLGRSTSRISWEDIEIVGTRLRLRETAKERRLGLVERRIARWLRYLPGSGYSEER